MTICVTSAPLGPAVIPLMVGPLQALLPILWGILIAIGTLLIRMFKPSAIKHFVQLLWAQKLIVVGLVAGVVGLVYLVSWAMPVRTFSAGQAEQGADWPMWRGNPARTGAAPGAAEPTSERAVWAFTDGAARMFVSSPAVRGNRLYVASALLVQERGTIYALDADTGQIAWTLAPRGYRETFSSPAVSGKYLVIGEGLHFTKEARVICADVEASDKQGRGVELWEYRTTSHVESSPCIWRDRVFVGAGDDGFYCLALAGDGKGGPKVLWHLSGPDYQDCETSAVVDDGKLYFGLGMGGKAVICVDPNTSQEYWRVPTPAPAFGSPSVAGGKLYFGMGWGNYAEDVDAVASNMRKKLREAGKTPQQIEEETRDIQPGGELWCIDLKTHEVSWKFPVAKTVLGPAAVSGERVYFGSWDGGLYCLSTEGKLIRKFDAHAPIVTGPSVGDKLVYFVTTAGRLYALDKIRLTEVWSASLNSERCYSSPAVARGHVYVGSEKAGLVCIGRPEVPLPLWPGHLGGPGQSGWLDDSLLATAGQCEWTTSVLPAEPNATSAPAVEIRAPAAQAEGALYVGVNRGQTHGLAKLLLTSPISKAEPNLAWFCPTANPVGLSAAFKPGAVFFVDGNLGQAGRALHCLDPASGAERWHRPVAPDAGGRMLLTYDELFIADTPAGLSCLDVSKVEAPRQLWRAATGPLVGMPCLAGDLVLAAASGPPRLVGVDRPTGAIVLDRTLAAAPQTGAVFAHGRVWVGNADGLAGYGLDPREADQIVPCGSVHGTLAADPDRLACLSDANELIVVKLDKAQVEYKHPSVSGGRVGPILAGDAVLYADGDYIQKYDVVTGKVSPWAAVRRSWPGAIVSPMILVQSHVLCATDKEGLLCVRPR